MESRTPTFPEVLNLHKERILRQLRVALPAKVERYDAAQQLVDVSPQVRELDDLPDGSTQSADLPVICNVPLCFPAAGGFSLTFPVAVGDTVLIVFADRSIDGWQAQGGVADPTDARRHHLSDAIAIPGLHPNNAAISDADGSVITIGKNGEAAEWAATGQRVLTELNKLKNAFDGHTHVMSVGNSPIAVSGAAGTITGVTGPASASPSLSEPSSASVKVKG